MPNVGQRPRLEAIKMRQRPYFRNHMNGIKRWTLLALVLAGRGPVAAQTGAPLQEEVRSDKVVGIKLFRKPDQQAFPVLRLGETEMLELHFDDMQSSSRSYFYTWVLCNADWTPVNLSSMDYIKGFSQQRLTQFRFSSATQQRYVHYQALLPAANSMPSRSGNYLLKVFENGDTSRLLFSRRLLVVNEKATMAVRFQQPFDQNKFLTHQKVVVDVAIKGFDVANPSRELKLVVMQNNQWHRTAVLSNPSFIRGKNYEYSDEQQLLFEGGKEWRWLDLRSFRLQSDRVASIDYKTNPYHVYVRADTIRSTQRYLFYNDINGRFAVSHLENINPWWQGDIGRVHFTLMTNEPEALADQNIYLYGELTQYQLTEQTRMKWNENLGVYETSILLKNGYYNYAYVTRPKNNPLAPPSFALTEGSLWEAENDYRVLLYYTPFGARSDELIGVVEMNTRQFFVPNR